MTHNGRCSSTDGTSQHGHFPPDGLVNAAPLDASYRTRSSVFRDANAATRWTVSGGYSGSTEWA